MRTDTNDLERIERSGVRVYVSNREVRNFRATWPCSNIPQSARFWFDFQPNGDLCGMFCSRVLNDQDAGAAVVALCDDALRYVIDLLPEQAMGHRDRLGC